MVKAVIRKSDTCIGGKSNIKLYLSHHRKVLYLSTNYFVEPIHFDNKRGIVKDSYPNAASLNINLKILILNAEQKILELGEKLHMVDVAYLKRHIQSVHKKSDVFAMFAQVISDKERSGSVKSSLNYKNTLNKLKEFYPYSELSFHMVDYRFLDDFQTYLKEKKLKVNTISINMRNIRSVFNKAINSDIIGYDTYPFRRFKIKNEQTRKRNLPASIISKIANVELSGVTEMARDIFMLSFYLIGINIPDLYDLKKTDVLSDRLRYRRQKTGKLVSVKIFPEARVIIDKYKGKKYLLNLRENYCEYNNFTKRINKELKTVAGAVGLIEEVSFYYARHSWATIGVTIGINQDVIGKALSHSNNTVTEVYTQYDPVIIDNANRKIIDHVISTQQATDQPTQQAAETH